MELLISLIIIIGVSELKEWRAVKRGDALDSRMITLTASIIELAKKIDKIDIDFKQIHKHVDNIESKLDSQAERLEDMRVVVDKTDISTETILKEHEISGIPLGYGRKQPDFIEGI